MPKRKPVVDDQTAIDIEYAYDNLLAKYGAERRIATFERCLAKARRALLQGSVPVLIEGDIWEVASSSDPRLIHQTTGFRCSCAESHNVRPLITCQHSQQVQLTKFLIQNFGVDWYRNWLHGEKFVKEEIAA